MPLTPLDEVRAAILGSVTPLPAVEVPVADALGCVTAEAVVAAVDVPPFDNSAMDGYAVRSADVSSTPVTLEVIGLLPAGAAPDPSRPVGRGEAIRIMTGACMPAGADAVVMVERTRADGPAGVLIDVPAEAGENVRAAGGDLHRGDVAIAAGTELTPAALGVAASVGRATLVVHRRPRVGVVSTGDELVEAPAPLGPGQIYDANRQLLLGLVAEAGCVPVDLGSAADDAAAILAAVSAALDHCDAILLSGGVSVGDFDFVGDVLARLGPAEELTVAIRPAKPLAWGVAQPGGQPLFGLPGNPVSAAVSFELFARPALRRLLGVSDPVRAAVPAVAADDFRRRPDGKLHLVRAVASWSARDGRLHVRSTRGQGSHMLASLAAGNALALVPDGDGLAAGDPLQVLLLGPALHSSA